MRALLLLCFLRHLSATVLTEAIQHFHVEAALEAIRKDTSIIDFPSPKGDPPIYLATKKRLPAIITALLENGANINALNRNGDTALIRAASVRSGLSITRLLLSYKVDFNVVNRGGITALGMASLMSHRFILAELLKIKENNGDFLEGSLLNLRGMIPSAALTHEFLSREKRVEDELSRYIESAYEEFFKNAFVFPGSVTSVVIQYLLLWKEVPVKVKISAFLQSELPLVLFIDHLLGSQRVPQGLKTALSEHTDSSSYLRRLLTKHLASSVSKKRKSPESDPGERAVRRRTA